MKPLARCVEAAAAVGWALWLAAPLLAQSASIEGVVTDSARGRPVAGVSIVLRGGPANASPGNAQVELYTTETDDRGHFLVGDMLPGRYTLVISRRGFTMPQTARLASAQPPSTLMLEAGQHLSITRQLTPMGVISGRLIDIEGDGVRDGTVQAMQYSYAGGKRQMNTRASAMTNDRGEYRIFNLPPGSYYLQASARSTNVMIGNPNEEIRGPRQQGFVTTYYPNARDSGGAGALQLAAGEELPSVDIHMLTAGVYTIRVTLPPQAPGQQLPYFSLQPLARGASPGFGGNFVNGSAVEMRGVLPGTYVLMGMLPNQAHPDSPASSRQIVEVVDHDVEVSAGAFNAVFEVAGTVKLEPPASIAVDRMRVSLAPDEPGWAYPGSAVGEDGTFQLKQVQPQSYHLQAVAAPRGSYLKVLKLGSKELPDLQVDFAGGGSPLTIVLGTDGGHIEGDVTNAAGEPFRALVTLVPDGRQRVRVERIVNLNTDNKGHYIFNDVAPGDYRLFAWDSADPESIRDPDIRKPYEEKAAVVKVEASGKMTVDLKAIVVQ